MMGNVNRLYHNNDISLVLTEKSNNRKTGDMIQTWIIKNDMLPTVAVKSGQDSAICGNCPHRNNSCYVNVGQAPNSIYKAMCRGSYDNKTIDTTGRLVRCGAYGDPAFMPLNIWSDVLRDTIGNTGYTHQWKRCDAGYADFLMASCDTSQDRIEAKDKGYRTFRVRRDNEPLLPGEIDCLASVNDKIKCNKCLICNGNKGKCKYDVSIVVHGPRKKNF